MENKLPKDKNGNIDYDSITDTDLFKFALIKDFNNNIKDITEVLEDVIVREEKRITEIDGQNPFIAKKLKSTLLSRIELYESLIKDFNTIQKDKSPITEHISKNKTNNEISTEQNTAVSDSKKKITKLI